MAVQLFQACNDMASVELTEHFFSFYNKWQNSECDTHLGIYFDMQVKIHIFINGSRKNQLEIVDFLANDIHRGLYHIYTDALRNRIHHIRTTVPYYE
jgi:hypothetical protein